MNKLISFAKRTWIRLKPNKKHFCCLCGFRVGGFFPYQGGWKVAPPLMSALNFIGSDLDNFSCPVCLSHDRERHLWMYLNVSGLLSKFRHSYVLHFAPEWQLSQSLASLGIAKYIKADLYPKDEDTQAIDLLSIPYAAASFDFLIANHVLEHVQDHNKALLEIRRVLRSGGYAILQTPYAACLKGTWEDSGIKDANQRLEAYGQADHVRLYGGDIFQRITETGFISNVKTHKELLSNKPAAYYGVNAQEPFMLFQKP